MVRPDRVELPDLQRLSHAVLFKLIMSLSINYNDTTGGSESASMKHTFLHKFQEYPYMHFTARQYIRFPYIQYSDITGASMVRQYIDFWWELDGDSLTQVWNEGILILNLERR